MTTGARTVTHRGLPRRILSAKRMTRSRPPAASSSERAVITARIIPSTVPGGFPGGSPNTKTKMNRPMPPIGPSAMPPRRAPRSMAPRSIASWIQKLMAPNAREAAAPLELDLGLMAMGPRSDRPRESPPPTVPSARDRRRYGFEPDSRDRGACDGPGPHVGRRARGRGTGGYPQGRRAHAHGEGPPGREADPGRRLLRRPDRAGHRELPDLGHRHQPLSRVRGSLGHREAGRGARQHRRRRHEAGDPRRHRAGRGRPPEGRVSRPVRRRLVPGGRGDVDEHERQRSDGQHRPREDRTQEGRVPRRRAARPSEPVAIDERLLPDGDQGGADPAQRQADPRAGGPGRVLPDQGRRVHRRRQDGAHRAAGRRPHDRRPGVPRPGLLPGGRDPVPA